MLNNTELVIFDCDGVLVDTEPATLRVMGEWANEHGLGVAPDAYASTFKGKHITLIQKNVEASIGRPIENFVEGYRERMFAEFAKGIDPIPGAVEVLDALDAAGIPYCVGSNGPHLKMDASLKASGLADRLGGPSAHLASGAHAKIFSADDVPNPKPAPDLFLFAAEKFGVDPSKCVVVEDSPSGIVAANNAKMRSVAFSDLTPVEELQAENPDVVITKMSELIDLLGIGATRG